ncbi:MAG: CvpA family protein [Bryobacteraceae bacterium]|nr:CvpA family protein [Bryobacteraceae bacterium]
MKNLNWLDFLFLAIFLASTLMGAAKGLARVGIGLAATVLGVLFASRWYADAGFFLREYVAAKSIANALGFLLVLVVFIVAGGVLAHLLAKLFKWAGAGWLDRLGGAVFGVLRALLVSIAIVMAAMSFPRDTLPKAVIQSRIAPFVLESSRLLALLTPPELKEAFARNYAEAKRIWAEL